MPASYIVSGSADFVFELTGRMFPEVTFLFPNGLNHKTLTYMKTLLFLGNFGGSELVTLLFALGICLLIFLAIRAIMLWYWKIDTIVENQEKQIDLLSSLVKRLKSPNALTEEEKAKLYDEQK